MSEENRQENMQQGMENEPVLEMTYILYNKTISMIQLVDCKYEEEMAESFEYAIFNILQECYANQEVYERVICYLKEHDIYTRYIKPILEIQYQSAVINSLPSEQLNNQGKNNQNLLNEKNKQNTEGNLKTREDKSTKIDKNFINRFYSDEDYD